MRRWIDFHNANLSQKPVVLNGISMGASTMLYLADEELPGNVCGIIADCGFTSPKEIIADVDGVGKREKAGKKDDEAAYNGTIPFIPDDKKEDEDSENHQEGSSQESEIKESVGDDEEVSKYKFVFGKGDMIEILDSTTGFLIKKIPIEQAQKAVGSIDKLPGFLVNREV